MAAVGQFHALQKDWPRALEQMRVARALSPFEPTYAFQLAVVQAQKFGTRVALPCRVTSVQTDETPDDHIEMLASGRDGRFRLRTPHLPITVNGAGDAIAALFFAHLLRTGSCADAMAQAGSSLFGVLKRTAERASRATSTGP